MRVFLTLYLTVFIVSPVFAQGDDAMEVQRCIWRCLSDSKGADDPAYQACVQEFCNDTKPGTWIFGEHPKLGLSAHVEIGEEAFGIACISDAAKTSSEVASRRMTRGLVPHATAETGVASVYIKPFQVGGWSVYKKASEDIAESFGNYCTLGIAKLLKSKNLLFLQEKFIGLDSSKKATVLTVEKDGVPVTIQTVKDLNQLAPAVSVPLEGAKSAMQQLLKSCPGLLRTKADGCTGGN